MRALMCSAAIANATLVAAGLITASPAAPEVATSSIAVQLTADGDLTNVPLNLLYDIINIPANALKALDALSYALFGQTRRALACWRRQAPVWESPNAGPVMSAGAGSLGLELGGAAIYHGAVEERPALGEGRPARGDDIPRALALMRRSLALWLALFVLGGMAGA